MEHWSNWSKYSKGWHRREDEGNRDHTEFATYFDGKGSALAAVYHTKGRGYWANYIDSLGEIQDVNLTEVTSKEEAIAVTNALMRMS